MDKADWDRRYEANELVWTASPNRFVVEELANSQPGLALDLGTGEGRNAVWLAEQGWQVAAVDFSVVALDKARHLAEDRGVSLDWVPADVRIFVPEPATFDLVLITYLHLPPHEWRPVLNRAAGALALGGTLLVVGHDRTNITEGVGGPQEPGILYTPESVTAELGGLDIRRAERVRRPVETEDGPRYAIDTLVRAERLAAAPGSWA